MSGRMLVSFVVLALAAIVGACASDPSPATAPGGDIDAGAGGGQDANAGPADGASAEGATAESGSLADGAPPDGTLAEAAASDGAADTAAPACTTLIDLSPGVTPVKRSGTAPVPSGGSFTSGTYVLTAVDYWGGTLSGAWHGTYRFAGSNDYEFAQGSYREQGAVAFSPTNTEDWTQRIDCPAQSGPWKYYQFTATGSAFVLSYEAPDGPRYLTYTRLPSDAGAEGG